jgi:hypothetical protein
LKIRFVDRPMKVGAGREKAMQSFLLRLHSGLRQRGNPLIAQMRSMN